MNVFLQPLSELEELQNALKQLKSNQGIVQISGCMDAQKAHMVFAANDGFRNKIIVTFNEQKAREILEDYRFFDRETLCSHLRNDIFNSIVSASTAFFTNPYSSRCQADIIKNH